MDLPKRDQRQIIQVVAFAITVVIVGYGPPRSPAQVPTSYLLRFDIDDKTPPHKLLPPVPMADPPREPTRYDLSRIPEVHFQDPSSFAKPSKKPVQFDTPRLQVAHQMAKINVLNGKKRDLFLETLLEHRPDLSGLPFVMGDASRLPKNERHLFRSEVELVRAGFAWFQEEHAGPQDFWSNYDEAVKKAAKKEKDFEPGKDRYAIAALMQILGPERQRQSRLVDALAAIGKPAEKEATEALTRLAVFSDSKDIRYFALKALQNRDGAPSTAVLLKGLRYPWQSVAENTFEAVVKLKRTDLIPELVKMLDEPDPRAPVEQTVRGKKVPVIRELVRINHLRNCLLCHVPGNTNVVADTPKNSVRVKDGDSIWKEVEKGVWLAEGRVKRIPKSCSAVCQFPDRVCPECPTAYFCRTRLCDRT